MRNIYLILAIVGAIVPMYFFSQFFAGGQPGAFLDFGPALFENGASGGFASDLLIASVVFWIFMWNRRGENNPRMWPFVLLNLGIGLSCAFPAYLYFAAAKQQ